MPTQWYYTQSGTKCGPVDSDTLKELVRSGKLIPADLLWKEGMPEWRPAGESKKLFEGNSTGEPLIASPTAVEATAIATEKENQEPSKESVKDDFYSSVGASVLIAVVATVALHATQWFVGWGWGSLWAVLSSVVILSCGILPWVRDHEGHKSAAAAFGAGVGGGLGAAYGWFSGGLLSGVLFCASIGTWAAWLGSIRGLTSKAAQAGIVAATLTGVHILGMLSPSAGLVVRGTGVAANEENTLRGKTDEYKQGWNTGTNLAGTYITTIVINEQAVRQHGQVYATNVEKAKARLREVADEIENQRGGIANVESNQYYMGHYEGFMSAAQPYLW